MKRAFLLGILLLSVVAIPFTSFAQEGATPTLKVDMTEDFAFGATLPDGWLMAGDRANGLVLANDETLLATVASEGAGTVPDSGLAYIQVITLTREEWGSAVEGAADMSLVELLEALLVMGGGEAMGTPAEVEFDGRTAGYLAVSQETADFAFMMHEVAPDVLAFTSIAAAPGEYAAQEEALLGILSGVGYSLELGQTYQSADGTVVVNYPTDWTFDETSQAISNDPAAFELGELGVGQYGIVVLNVGDAFGAIPVDLDNANGIIQNMMIDTTTQQILGPINLEIGEEAVSATLIQNTDEESTANEGGYFVIEREDGFYAVLFFSAPDDYDMVSFTALTMLLQPEALNEVVAPEATEEASE